MFPNFFPQQLSLISNTDQLQKVKHPRYPKSIIDPKSTKQNIDFNNQSLEQQNLFTEKKIMKLNSFPEEILKIDRHSQIKNLQEIFLYGSLIGCFSNFPYKDFLSSPNILEIGPDKQLYGIKHLRSYCLDAIIVNEWDNALLQKLMNFRQHFYFFIKNERQLDTFLFICYQTRKNQIKIKADNQETPSFLTINIFPTQNQIFIVGFQMLSSNRPEKQLFDNQNSLFSQDFLQLALNNLKLDKTSQTCVEEQSIANDMKKKFISHSSDEQKCTLQHSQRQRTDEWIIDSQFLQDSQKNQKIFFPNISQQKKNQEQNSEQSFSSQECILHKIGIYNGIEGEDNRQIVFSNCQIPKKYSRSVCTYEQLQSRNKDLQESIYLDPQISV